MELKHFGVLGMRWGNKKKSNSSSVQKSISRRSKEHQIQVLDTYTWNDRKRGEHIRVQYLDRTLNKIKSIKATEFEKKFPEYNKERNKRTTMVLVGFLSTIAITGIATNQLFKL